MVLKMQGREYRCYQCNRKLGFGQVVEFQIKCTKCKCINQLSATSSTAKPSEVSHGTQPNPPKIPN
ncbi:Com family DNA-binding transcriptional regulator [Ephemeroptericola cinctiostellae]|uniref:Com family DNA-binding transcriptional regulator n=1 Tax=Ephemeroptericola cinctiostellae TaxID=2268024 RepID=UPI000DF736BD